MSPRGRFALLRRGLPGFAATGFGLDLGFPACFAFALSACFGLGFDSPACFGLDFGLAAAAPSLFGSGFGSGFPDSFASRRLRFSGSGLLRSDGLRSCTPGGMGPAPFARLGPSTWRTRCGHERTLRRS